MFDTYNTDNTDNTYNIDNTDNTDNIDNTYNTDNIDNTDNTDNIDNTDDTYEYIINSSFAKYYSNLMTTEIIKYDINDLKKEILNIEPNETNLKNIEEENEYYDTILKTIENIFTSENYDTSKLDNGEDEVITTKK